MRTLRSRLWISALLFALVLAIRLATA